MGGMPVIDGEVHHAKEGLQRAHGLLTHTRHMPHLVELCCEKPKTEAILTDEAAMHKWLKREDELVRWCGERWLGFTRSLLHVSPIAAKRPMLLASPHYHDDPCSPNVEKITDKWWEKLKLAHAGRHGHFEATGATVRHHHTLNKLQFMLEVMDEIKDELERPDMVELAIWFHDIVYDTKSERGYSENASAEMLKEFGDDVTAALASDGHALHVDHACGRLALGQLQSWVRATQNHFECELPSQDLIGAGSISD